MNKDRINYIRSDLEFAALQYARLKCFRTSKDTRDKDSGSSMYCEVDAKNYADYWTRQMQSHAVELLQSLEADLPERNQK